MTKRSPKPEDILIGQRIRMARTLLSMSQGDLGGKLGVTFQQIQKYEKGSNRVGGSRMVQIANALKQPVSYFFNEGAGKAKGEGVEIVQQMLVTPRGVALAKAFLAIEHNADRIMVADLAERLAA
jgi:transcriptional regulator with XRE-family HTH domain